MSEKAILFDSSKCTGCKGCQIACKCWNNLPSPTEENACVPSFTGTYQNPPDLNGMTRLIMTFDEQSTDDQKGVEWAFGRRSCMHCTDAPCVEVCSGGALSRNPETGFVEVNTDKCIGCQYCSGACPYDVPRYEDNGPLGKTLANKCTGCPDRVAAGMDPACVTTCQPQALQFGDRDELIAYGKERVQTLKERGYKDASLYGEDQIGGSHVLHVLKYGLDRYELPAEPEVPATVGLNGFMKPLTGVAAGLTVVGLGAMMALATGYSRRRLAYNPETEDTLDVDTGEVVKHGDGPDTASIKEHFSFGKKGGDDE